MPTQNRKLKVIEISIGGPSPAPLEFQCQVQSWNLANNTEIGEKQFAYCPDGEFREEVDPDYVLELTLWSDWRTTGISEYLWANDGLTKLFQLDHHPDIPAEHIRWTGSLYVLAPSVGGEVRTTEQTTVSLPIIGKPTRTRPVES